ncbi:transposase [Nonomuraea sp. PA05]|uniref:transposase n=1 Tax=Nonomuraea sp. PA05 TaxID=2604466 RepID=UPI0011D9B484|nr:transposase [Nonomuraea sp. PA05]TYB69337.1 transposase [Nonomuraea sp. PA05]
MTRRRRQSSPDFKEEAVRMVLEGERTVASVAREFDINASTLDSWVNRHRIVHARDGQRPVSGPDRARIRELKRENAELREKLIFLKKQPPSSRPRLDDARQVRAHRRGEGLPQDRADVRLAGCVPFGLLRVARAAGLGHRATRALLATLVAEIFAGSHETYGYRRVHAAPARRGEHCSAELVCALMREQGLIPAQVRAFRPATTVQGDYRGRADRQVCPANGRTGLSAG